MRLRRRHSGISRSGIGAGHRSAGSAARAAVFGSVGGAGGGEVGVWREVAYEGAGAALCERVLEGHEDSIIKLHSTGCNKQSACDINLTRVVLEVVEEASGEQQADCRSHCKTQRDAHAEKAHVARCREATHASALTWNSTHAGESREWQTRMRCRYPMPPATPFTTLISGAQRRRSAGGASARRAIASFRLPPLQNSWKRYSECDACVSAGVSAPPPRGDFIASATSSGWPGARLRGPGDTAGLSWCLHSR